MLAFTSAAFPQSPPGRSFPLPLSPDLPYDVDRARVDQLDGKGNVLEAQREFDILAWQAFVALNWPATADGKPARDKTIADDASERVWSFWRPASTIFLPDGAPPKPWDATEASADEASLFRAKAAWRQDTTSADQNFQAFSGPLVDQNGKWVRYQVLVNEREFDYIIKNKLYSLDGQVEFSQKLEENEITFPVDDIALGQHGAIEVKFAWKELGANDDRSRFFTRRISVQLAEPYPEGKEPETREIDAGLVGVHIAMRTRSSPEWIWATFEQIDNVRPNPAPGGGQSHPSFFNPQSHAKPNQLPPKNAVIDPKTGSPEPEPDPNKATTWIEHLTTTPVQVIRLDVPHQGTLNPLDKDIAASTAALNAEVQAALRSEHSVFQNYELIGTQWPIHPNAPAFAGGADSAPESITHKTPGDMVPIFLVNTTMETYFQLGDQPAGPLEQDDRLAPCAPPIDSTRVIGTESCVGCHYSAGAAVGFKRNFRYPDGSFDGSLALDENGRKIPIFGENSHFGKTGNGQFSWLLQIEAKTAPLQNSAAAKPREPAGFIDIHRLIERLITQQQR
jgi:hypothetical protein